MPIVSYSIRIGGRVQGVGFRPFLYRLAHAHSLTGWVQNSGGEVNGIIQGSDENIAAFIHALPRQSPPMARPEIEHQQAVTASPFHSFTIRDSTIEAQPNNHLPPDYFACTECLAEMQDPANRRYRYPFINCTQCGPRYTLINALPYDRDNTSMRGFPLCTECNAEYANPLDRRFHAEPIACPVCGPTLGYEEGGIRTDGNESSLSATVSALREGKIVAVKGVGGYHLMCDAGNQAAVQRLRQRKHRPDKPLAIMFPWHGDDGLGLVETETRPSDAEKVLLTSPERPIVLCRRTPDGLLAASIAPRLDEVGVMLPYSPLHHLLLNDFKGPLVATSGNISGEPVLTDNLDAVQRLHNIADAFLHHDRPILRPADDSVYRVIADTARPIRLGRGVAPVELHLPFTLEQPTLAVGAHMKNSIALAWEDRLILSPHIGELSAPRSMQVFEQVITDLQKLYGIKAERVLCDAHPGYAATRWARASGLPVQSVYHHHAHASALYAEQHGTGSWLVFTWDGVGYGEDRTLWGGEALLGQPGNWRRVARLRPFRLPGADKAGREPWRSALALCWECGLGWGNAPKGSGLLKQAWQRQLNSPQTSAAGRLFDAAAALLGLCTHASFEGQGPMQLEAIASATARAIELPIETDGDALLSIDWRALLPVLLDASLDQSERAGVFQVSLARAVINTAEKIHQTQPFDAIGLSGGVFQNRLLSETILALSQANDWAVKLHENIPSNDGAIAYGQIIDAGYPSVQN